MAVAIAARDPRTPWPAKLLAALVVAYALSPIDLIPDFIPVLGYLDDLIVVPLGIWLVLRLIPDDVMADARAKAAESGRPGNSLWGLVIVVALWIGAAVLTWRMLR
ncbi:MAG: YkvA family protein [Bacteroidota bacterium]